MPLSQSKPASVRTYDDIPPDVACLHNAQAGDREAFAELYRRNARVVRRYLFVRMSRMGWIRDLDSVADLVQETFCEAFADLTNARDDVRGWLILHAACAFNRYDWGRRRYLRAAYLQYHRARTSRLFAQDDEPAIPDRLRLWEALPRLGSDQRRCVQLRYLEGLPAELVAGLMGRTTNAVRLLERRALIRLRVVLTALDA